MRGTLADWKQSQGFGFITPDAGGERVFVHHSAFLDRKRQPAVGMPVVYELTPHKKRGVCASNVTWADAPVPARANQGKVSWFALAFLSLLGAVTARGHLPSSVLMLYLAATVISFIAYAFDKAAARGDRRRVPESTLNLIDILGGWPGGRLAQQFLRHKSGKKEFQFGFWLSVLINCAGLAWLLSANGSAMLRQWFS